MSLLAVELSVMVPLILVFQVVHMWQIDQLDYKERKKRTMAVWVGNGLLAFIALELLIISIELGVRK